MKKGIPSSLRFIFFFAAVACASQANGQQSESEIRRAIAKSGPEAFIRMVAKKYSGATGPLGESEVTGVVAINRSLVFYMRLPNFYKRDIDTVALRRITATNNAPAICLAPIASILINEYEVSYDYIFYSKSREYLFRYEFNKETCRPDFVW